MIYDYILNEYIDVDKYTDLCSRCKSYVVSQVETSAYSLARCKLENLLNKSMRIRMTDGRTLVGLFLCTDRDCNVILGSAQEFLKSTGV